MGRCTLKALSWKAVGVRCPMFFGFVSGILLHTIGPCIYRDHNACVYSVGKLHRVVNKAGSDNH